MQRYWKFENATKRDGINPQGHHAKNPFIPFPFVSVFKFQLLAFKFCVGRASVFLKKLFHVEHIDNQIFNT